VRRQVPTGVRYCGTRCGTRAKDDRRLALERPKRARLVERVPATRLALTDQGRAVLAKLLK
jgi:hypothetical protein